MSHANQPYERYTDAELESLVADAVDLKARMLEPTDAEVEACLIEHGMPATSAGQFRRQAPLALFARRFYLDVQDAAKGDPGATARVQQCEDVWADYRARGRL